MPQASLDDAIEISGYPLQQLVARKLERQGLSVRHEWAFKDSTTDILRTTDLLANKWLFTPDQLSHLRVRPELDLLIECKKSRDPYVFFLTDPPIFSNVFPFTAGLKKNNISIYTNDDPSSWTVNPVDIFGLQDHEFLKKSPGLSLNFAKAHWKPGGKIEITGEDPYKSLVLPMVSAMRQFAHLERPISSAAYFDLHLILGVAVIDAPMVGVEVKAKGHKSKPLPWIRVMRHEPNTTTRSYEHHGMLFAIDVVHVDYLDQYIEKHLLPFAEVFGKQALSKQEVLRSGKGFVSGMGKHGGWKQLNEAQPVALTDKTHRFNTILKRILLLPWHKS